MNETFNAEFDLAALTDATFSLSVPAFAPLLIATVIRANPELDLGPASRGGQSGAITWTSGK
jgi:hypothetical protein